MDKKLYNLTSPQKSIWLTEQFHKNTNINNVCGVFETSIPVDLQLLKKSIKQFVKNNESFRIRLTLKDGEIKQYFSEFSDFQIKTVSLNSTKERIDLEKLENSKGFKLLNSRLFNFTLFKYPNGNGGYIVNSNHIVSDSWTSGLLVNEITRIYNSLKNKNEILNNNTYSYSSYITSEQEYLSSEKFIKDKNYWNSIFETIPEEVATIPCDKDIQNNVFSYKAKRYLTNIDSDKFEKLKKYAQKNKVSLYNLLTGIFSLYISRVSNLNDFVIGTPILNRTNFKEKQTAGMFINVLPLRINVNSNQKFSEFTSQIAINSMGLLRHQRYSYNNIIEDLRKKDPSIPNLYNIIMSYQITKMTGDNDLLPHKTSWTFNGSILNDLELHFFEWNDTNTLQFAYDYKASKYSGKEIINIHNRIVHIINQILENEDILLKDIEIVTSEEKNKILNELNNTKIDYPNNKTISELFEEQVEKNPDKTALVFENKSLTYKELNEKANSLANYLINKGAKPNDVIGIFIDKSLEMVISMFAILKAHCIFLPLDTEYPSERITYITEDSKVKFILTFEHLKEKLPNNSIDISLSNDEIYSKFSKANLKLENYSSEDVMYIIYTSGSTGKPKGVLVKHKNIARLICNQNFISFKQDETMVQTGTIAFDACIFEIFGALVHGFKLHILKKDTLLNINKLEEFLIENKITILFLTTGLFNELGNLNPKIFKNLRYLMTGGDVISRSAVSNILKSCPNINLVNCYGPTENGSYSTCFNIPSNWNENYIPIGKPIANSTTYIVSNDGNLQPFGVPGELWVGGDGIGKGYVNRDDLTKKNFIKSPFNSDFIYKTGDLVKYDKYGNICFINRIDNQVKLRGFRIELGEIDSSILKFKNIKESLTLISKSENTASIFSYITSYIDINIKELKKYLSNNLPKYMMPTEIIQIPAFPVNLNGKIDRKKLPIPKNKNKENITKPRNEIDKILIKFLSELLGIPKNKISISESFFDLGGDSLNAISLSSKIYSKLNIEIFAKDILTNPIISDISDFISSKIFQDTTKSKKNIVKVKKADFYITSSSQKNIYYATKLDGEDSILYNIPGGIIFDKTPNIKKLENCFKELISRHESFRTYFDIENDTIVQKILDNIDFKLEVEKNPISINDLDNEFKAFVKPFDFTKAPLLHSKLLKLDDNRAVLFIDMHHIISDGASLTIFINELSDLYNEKTLEKIKFTYKDFAYFENEALRNKKFNESEKYWINLFNDDLPILNMPTNYQRPVIKSYEGAKVYSNIDSNTFSKIEDICKNLSITPYMFLLGVYYILLSKYTGQNDIIVGSPIANRTIEEFSDVIGMFVNTLPYRAKIDSSLSFKEFLENIKNICLENYKHGNYPFNELLSKLKLQRDSSRSPLFDTLFIYQNNGLENLNFNKIKSEFFIPDNKISKYDISLEILPQEDNSLKLNFEYCTKLFTKLFIENFSNHYKNILNTVLDNLDIEINSICVLSEKEKNKVVYEFNNTKMDYPTNKTVSQLFEEQVEKTPDNTAIIFENKELTYKQLNEKANSLANYLRNNDVTRGKIVGIMVNRSLEMIISILAVLKSGATYIPIDPEYPQDRVEYMLENSNCKALLTFESLENKVPFENKIFVELSNKEIYSLNKNNLENINEPDDLSYIIYTSGSTGLPKGVQLKHKSLTNLQKYLKNNFEFFNGRTQKTVVSVTTVSFDIFLFETILSLASGLKLVICNEEEQYMPQNLYDLLEKHNVDMIQMTPSRMKIFIENLDIKRLSKIKYVVLAGEPLPTYLVKKLKSLSVKNIYNGYGPSETTVFSTFTDVTDYNTINIGKPLSNTQFYILDNNLQPLPIGVPGELYISGDGVGNGYLNNPEKTTDSFIPNPFIENTIMYKTGDICKYLPNTEVDYLERADNQVKIRGLRIELGEIEAKLISYPSIKKAVVIKQNINNRDFISAYFTIKKKVVISKLRQYLSKYLPKYMVPSYFTILDDFPYTPNGKINKKALPLPSEVLSSSREEYVAPKTDLQIKIKNIFENILNVSPIGINDNFFDLGGDSILAMNLNIELKKITDNISYSDVFKYPSVSELERKINSSDEEYDFKYLEQNYSKYNDILKQNKNIPNSYKLKYKETGNILLTGSTGFLGIHILDSFIKSEKGNIYCIVRKEPGLAPELKLLQKLHYYFGNKYDKLIGKRIFIITGDICSPGFGLGQEELLNLSNNIDIVINSAASVSHYGKYSDFYNINVKSVKYIIDFCKSFNKKLYHISTISVSGNSVETSSVKQNIVEKTIFDETSLYIGQSLENVYVRSKFEAECLVLNSILEGVDSYILRMGNLMPRFKDGVFQENFSENAYINRIISFLKVGEIPDYLEKAYLELTPVDTTANFILKLITHPSENNRIFHLLNQNYVYLTKFLEYIKILDKDFKVVDEETFKNRIKEMLKKTETENDLNYLINDFDKELHLTYFTDIIIESKITEKYLQMIGFSWPGITDRYLNNFINLLRMVL